MKDANSEKRFNKISGEELPVRTKQEDGTSHFISTNQTHPTWRARSLFDPASEQSWHLGQEYLKETLQVQAEIDVINASWNPGGSSNGLADTIGLMVYEGTQALIYLKNYIGGSSMWQGFPIKVRNIIL